MNRLRAQAELHRNNLNRYKAGLANLHTNLQQLDKDLLATKQQFEALTNDTTVDASVMKLYTFNEQVA